MTTNTVPASSIPASTVPVGTVSASTVSAGTVSGKSSGRAVLAAQLSTATAETPYGQRVRGLLAELGDIEQDREMAARFPHPGPWLADLAREERDVWAGITEALSSAHTKEEQ